MVERLIMKKTTQQKLDEAYQELKEIALELADDLQISDDLGGNYSCFIDKEIYHTFQKMSEKINKLYDKQKEEDKKQMKFAFK